MTIFDLGAVLIALLYAFAGVTTGLIRRVVGLIAVYVGIAAGTFLGQDGGRFLLNFKSGLAPADARIYAFWGFFLIVVLVIEGLAAAYHRLLQFSFVFLDRLTGLLLGLVTGGVVTVLAVFLLNGAGNPATNNPTLLQTNIRQTLDSSLVRNPALNFAPALVKIFGPALPADPSRYFSVPRQT